MTLHFDVAIWRRVVEMVIEDRQRAALGASAARGTALVAVWQTDALIRKSHVLCSRSHALCETSARLCREAEQVRGDARSARR
jgi:hypothetical protein